MTEMEFSPRTKGRKIRTMDSALDLKNLEKELTTLVAEDDLYWLRNDQKLRAIGNTKSYEEFDALVKESTQHLFSRIPAIFPENQDTFSHQRTLRKYEVFS